MGLSTTGTLGAVAMFFKRFNDPLAMVALYFDDTVLDGAARAASGTQLLTQQAQRQCIQCQPLDQSHALAATALAFARHAYHAIACDPGRLLAEALRECLPAFRAHASPVGGVDKATS